jgi:mannose/cellobiose epimerase-like protein (N-acyl-D-glucosamine 2-epimerase family)
MDKRKPRNYFLIPLILALFCVSCQGTNDSPENKILDGEYWRLQGLTQIIPFWQKNARDTVNGAFYMALTREGKPLPPWDKYPAMISRQIYGFTAAYLMSGNEIYLSTAREAAETCLG